MSGSMRVVVCVPDTESGRAYLRCGAFDLLAARYDVVTVTMGASPASPPSAGDAHRLPPESPARARRRARARTLELLRHRARTTHYRDAFARVAAHHVARIPAWRRGLYRLPAALRAVGAPRVRVGGANPEDGAVAPLIRRLAPRLVIGHYEGYDSATIDVVEGARAAGVPVMLLQSTWEAFVQAPPLPSAPDYVGVWGLQSALWAEIVQGLPKSRLFFLGAPFRPRESWPDADAVRARYGLASGRFVLVDDAGTSLGAPALLRDMATTARRLGLGGVLYRGAGTTAALPPGVVRLPAAIDSCERLALAAVVVGRPDVRILEALASGVPGVVLADRPEDGLPIPSYMEAVPGCVVCRAPATVAAGVERAIASAAEARHAASLRAQVRAAAYEDAFPLADRLAEAVAAVVESASASRYHYLADPILNVDTQDNVVDGIVGDDGRQAYAYFDPDMIDSEELGKK
jgi:hypothetical protein